MTKSKSTHNFFLKEVEFIAFIWFCFHSIQIILNSLRAEFFQLMMLPLKGFYKFLRLSASVHLWADNCNKRLKERGSCLYLLEGPCNMMKMSNIVVLVIPGNQLAR